MPRECKSNGEDQSVVGQDGAILPDERTFVARIRQGDPSAFAELMALYANRLIRFAFFIVGSRDSADDVVQQVFVQLWEHRESLDPGSQIRAFLFRAVRNRALDDQRAKAVRSRYVADAQSKLDAASVPSPEGGILTSTVVQTAIESLPERRQLALRLRLREEMTHAEIAEVLGVSPEAAQRLVARAVADLREILRGSV